MTQTKKGAAVRVLYQCDKTFIMPNPFDVSAARLLANLGLEALGRLDNPVHRNESIAHSADRIRSAQPPPSASC